MVAYSGGIDSHVLLHWLTAQRPLPEKRRLTAAHVDHRLHPDSGGWAEHCRRTCEQWDVPLRIVQVDARPKPGESPEAAARQARYQALRSLLEPEAAVLTAHQQDDQAETLLLQLLRGAGPGGLAAMPAVIQLGRGWLWRPLLEIERARIVDYAQHHGLQWIDDASNADRRPDRNYLRHEILPRLKARWPAATRTLARSARWCAETAEWLDAAADADLRRATHPERPACLLIPVLLAWDEPRQCNVLRRWLHRLELPAPASAQLARIVHEVMPSPRDRRPLVRWPGCEIRRYRDHLYAMAPLPAHVPERRCTFDPALTECVIPGIGRLHWRTVRGQGIKLSALAKPSPSIRFRRGGERLRPAGRHQVHALKNLFQEAGIPPWERDRLPLLYVGEALAAVGGLWVAAEFAAAPGEDGLVLDMSR